MDRQYHAATIEFGRFKVLSHRRELLSDSRPVALSSRAFDLLVTLIEAGGEILSSEELIRHAWPGSAVDDSTLQAQISAIQKALAGDQDLVRTVAGRGYQFTGEVRSADHSTRARQAATNLPQPISELIGRQDQLSEVIDRVAAHRMVTLVGAGGIGKTRLGLEAARHLLAKFADGVWLAELGSVSAPELVPVNVARALGLTLAAGRITPERVAAAIGPKRMLLVLDNCEHVIDSAARMAEALLRLNPLGWVLATSREPIRVDGESLYWVPALELPDDGVHDAHQLLQFGAVHLFVERMGAATTSVASGSQDLRTAANICRRLYGIPLAIELAAARAAAAGLERLAADVQNQFSLFSQGDPGGLAQHHHTMLATLDWSHQLLSEPERMVLRRLAVFAGSFTLEAAIAVTRSDERNASSAIEAFTNLVEKSLVVPETAAPNQRYRLLETTKAYALTKLVEHGERDTVAERHAKFYEQLFGKSRAIWDSRPKAEWLSLYRPEIDNLRAALDWAFEPSGHVKVGVTLMAAAALLMYELGLTEECRERCERALAAIEAQSLRDEHCELELRTAWAAGLIYTAGPSAQIESAWNGVLELAVRLGDDDHRARALWGLWARHEYGGMPRKALAAATEFSELVAAPNETAKMLYGHQFMARAFHYLGDQIAARRHVDYVLAHADRDPPRWYTYFQSDHAMFAYLILARILWLQGLGDQASRLSIATVEDALAYDHAQLSCYVLIGVGIPIALMADDRRTAKRYVATLMEQAVRHRLLIFEVCAGCFDAALRVRSGDLAAGVPALRRAIEALKATGFTIQLMMFWSILAEGLRQSSKAPEGLAVVDEALAEAERNEARWYFPELLRVKGELVLQHTAEGALDIAEQHFRQAMGCAREQGALSWELRCAVSLAQLWHKQAKTREAHTLLAAVYERFTEGHDTEDLLAAKMLLDRLR